jgi:hypothetical protein
MSGRAFYVPPVGTFVTSRNRPLAGSEYAQGNLNTLTTDGPNGKLYNDNFSDVPIDHLHFYFYTNPELEPVSEQGYLPEITQSDNTGHKIIAYNYKLSDGIFYNVLAVIYNGKRLKIKLSGTNILNGLPYFYVEDYDNGFNRKYFGEIIKHAPLNLMPVLPAIQRVLPPRVPRPPRVTRPPRQLPVIIPRATRVRPPPRDRSQLVTSRRRPTLPDLDDFDVGPDGRPSIFDAGGNLQDFVLPMVRRRLPIHNPVRTTGITNQARQRRLEVQRMARNRLMNLRRNSFGKRNKILSDIKYLKSL